ncbi:N-formylglutamate amidohydrolase [Tenacibaculum sp. 190524A05c]|uniref:N-formylglutamate amidohydrolase n=1 Tax=Tenacibaculum platacis TaxID=3137852 RepID=UPI0032B1FEB5
MEKLSVKEIIQKINAEELFEAVASNYSFTIKIEEYVPFVCAAVHDGHQFRKELWDNCLHSEYERWYEEDPCTKEMVDSNPIVIAGLDSRFEYDLNRAPESAIYDDAWGKQLWKTFLPETMKEKSLAKHQAFYRVVEALISKIEEKHNRCIVYDMHSYNWKRWDREVPTWNLGTANVDNDRFKEDIENWRLLLEQMPLPNEIKSTSKINDTFEGNGYFLKFITEKFDHTLVLATEIAKVYCDELEQVIYPEVVKAVKVYLDRMLKEHAKDFYTRHKS